MRLPNIARTTGVFARVARRTRQVRLLDGVPGSGRGSAAFGVAIVALTTRLHPHYGTSTGTSSTTGLIILVVVAVIFFIVRWFMRNRRS
jgi:hypothetical protein